MDVLLGLPFLTVSMERKKERGSLYGKSVVYIYTDGVVWPKEHTAAVNQELFAGKMDLRIAIASMAGPQSEAMIIGEVDGETNEGASSDMNGIKACCRLAVTSAESKLEKAQITNLPPCAMEMLIVNAVAAQAKELLLANWKSVEAVANALNDRKLLARDEVARIMKSVRDENELYSGGAVSC